MTGFLSELDSMNFDERNIAFLSGQRQGSRDEQYESADSLIVQVIPLSMNETVVMECRHRLRRHNKSVACASTKRR